MRVNGDPTKEDAPLVENDQLANTAVQIVVEVGAKPQQEKVSSFLTLHIASNIHKCLKLLLFIWNDKLLVGNVSC